MKNFLKKLVGAAVFFCGAAFASSWGMFAAFIMRKEDKASEKSTEEDLKHEADITDEYQMLDIKGLKWKQAHMDICERVTIESEDGLELAGYYFDQGANKTALVVHGITAWHGSLLFMGSIFFDEGYNVLAIDQRAHGESEGMYRTMGYKESDDMIRWMRWLVDEKKQQKIMMGGVSMGAATVMICSGRDDLPKEVIGIVEDCGFTSLCDMMEHQLKNGFHIPTTFPFVNIVKMYCAKVGGFKVDERTPIEMVAKTKVPMLFIHGTEDDFVPYEMVDRVYNACNSEKYIFRMEGAEHALSCMKYPELYSDTIREFIHKVNKEI